jgi:hypothetical protein
MIAKSARNQCARLRDRIAIATPVPKRSSSHAATASISVRARAQLQSVKTSPWRSRSQIASGASPAQCSK